MGLDARSRNRTPSGHATLLQTQHTRRTAPRPRVRALRAAVPARFPLLPALTCSLRAASVFLTVRALDGRRAYGLLYFAAVRRRTCRVGRSQLGDSPQLLALRRLSPREPSVPVAYALAQLGLLNTELFTGELRVRVAISVSLRVSESVVHDGLLICAVSSDGRRCWCSTNDLTVTTAHATPS